MAASQRISLVKPERLWSRAEVLVRDCPVPRAPGVYAWYFRHVPKAVPREGCLTAHGATLLYVGISPRRPPTNGAPASRQSLRSRIRYHYGGNAAGSTLRLTLGCLLAAEIGTTLRRVGSGQRFTFADREQDLSEWMERNALVTWLPTEAPWELERTLITSISLPLNRDQNHSHPFHETLSECWREARHAACDLPVWSRA